MPTRKFKLLASLLFLGIAGAVGTLFFLSSRVAVIEDFPVGNPLPGRRLTRFAPAQAPLMQIPKNEFAGHHGKRRHFSDGGVETEADFFGEIRDWARKDPEAALAWAQAQPDSDDARKEALTDACFQIVQNNPERAVELAERFNLNQDAVLANLAQQWAAKDLTAASAWVANQPEGDPRNALVKGVAFIWSQTDPVAAAQFVVERMSPGSALDASLVMVIHQWAITNLAGATAWVEQYPAGPLHDSLMLELAHVAQYRQSVIR